MRQKTPFALGAVGLVAGVALGALAANGLRDAGAADHKDAPEIRQESGPADINDVYVFTSPSNGANTVLAMTVNPFVDPATNTSAVFDATVSYRFNIDRDGDAIADYIYDVRFAEPGTSTAQRITVNGVNAGLSTGNNENVASGPDPAVANAAAIDGASHTIFAGLREDPFFFDLVAFVRAFSTTPASLGNFSRGIDSFSAVNTDAIVIEAPTSFLQGPGAPASRKINVWASTHR